MPARKHTTPAEPTVADVPPGPISLEVRAGLPGQEKVVWRQNAHSFEIDPQGDKAVITAVLRLPAE